MSGADRTPIAALFAARYPDAGVPTVLRAPGRVNLVGEHTDYNGYPVLPIAIDRGIEVAFVPGGDAVAEIANADPRFGDRRFSLPPSARPFADGDWGNYAAAAVRGLYEDGVVSAASPRGLRALYRGDVPAAAGLSSSSALVVATACAFLDANGAAVPTLALAELLARAERHAGLEGGGMDQAISLLGRKGSALRIDFFPLRAETVPLPPRFAFVVCHSFVPAPKTAWARDLYNLRVVECRLATAMLAITLERRTGRRIDAARLADLDAARAGLPEYTLADLARECFGPETRTLDRIARDTGLAKRELVDRCCTLHDGTVVPEPTGGFALLRRYRHVVSEARRVRDAVGAARDGDLARFGSIMDASHASCRDDYGVSGPELDALADAARRAGAAGARLTGAGFGGCVVALLERGTVDGFRAAVERDYHRRYIAAHPDPARFSPPPGAEPVFAVEASDGAARAG